MSLAQPVRSLQGSPTRTTYGKAAYCPSHSRRRPTINKHVSSLHNILLDKNTDRHLLGVWFITHTKSCTAADRAGKYRKICIIQHAHGPIVLQPIHFQLEYIPYWSRTRGCRLSLAQTNCQGQQHTPLSARVLRLSRSQSFSSVGTSTNRSTNPEHYSVDKKNQLDVTFCILYFSSNRCSICFGQPCAHHQELTTA